MNTTTKFFPIAFRIFFILNALVFFPPLLDPVLYSRFVFLNVFLLIILFVIYYSKPWRITLTGIMFLALALSIIYLLSAFMAIYPGEAIYSFLKIFSMTLLFILTSAAMEQNFLSRRDIIISMLLFCLVIALIAIGQIIYNSLQHENFFLSMINVRSTAGNKNLLSIILFWSIAAGGLLLIGKKNYALLLFICTSFVLIVLLYSRAVLLAIVAGAVLTILLSVIFNSQLLKKYFPSKKNIAMTTGFCVLVFSVILLGKNYQPFISNTHTFDTRAHLFGNSLKMISENWLTGVGGGNWQIYFPKYGLTEFQPETASGYLTYQRPHNDFLWVFSETGILGFAIYCFIFGYIVYTLIRKIKSTLTKEDFYEANLLLFAVIGYIFIANFDFPLERMEHQELLLMFFVLAEHRTDNNSSSVKTISIPKASFLLIFLLVCFSLTVGIFKIKGESTIKKAFAFKQKAQWESVIGETEKSENYFYRLDPYSNPVSWYKGVGYFTLGDMDKALDAFTRAYRIHPYNIHVLNNLAGTYARKADYVNAINYYRSALKISPQFSESLVNLSAVYYNKGDYEKAYYLIMSIPDTCTQPNYQVFKKAIIESVTNKRSQ